MATNPISEVVELALYHGREETNIEYKGDVPWTNRKKEREIMQSIFAMSNEEDGGIILIGVADDGTRTGLSTANFATYSHDTINRRIENKGNQPIACKVDKITLKDKVDGTEKNFVIIQVPETREFPFVYTGGLELCNASQPPHLSNIALRKSALYIRNKTSVGNKEIETTQEWQELIERTQRKYDRETARRVSLRGDTKGPNPFDKELSI